jgi:glucosamine--fructose-6-phosphate aminotransferase (isomerizing)
MCGIIAYLNKSNLNIYDTLVKGLETLQNRGYDSSGIVTSNGKTSIISKYASVNLKNGIELLKDDYKKHENAIIGIGHTRWATHGLKTDVNAHPHSDYKNRIYLVHNGIIDNYLELKNELESYNIPFKSQTDTEVIANLIGYYLDLNYLIEDSIKHTMNRLDGSYALTILYDNDNLYVCKSGNPIVIGKTEEECFILSEPSFLINKVDNYIILNDNDLIYIKKENNKIILNCLSNKQKEFKKFSIYKDETFKESFLPFDNWTIKEINDQIYSTYNAINKGNRIVNEFDVKLGGLENHKERLLNIKYLYLIGCGTSHHASIYGSVIIKKLGCFNTVNVIDASEFVLDDLPNSDDVTDSEIGVLFLSQSGETKDVHMIIQLIKHRDIIRIGVVNIFDSLISRETDCGVYINAGREVGVASTKSFTNQCIILILIGIWFTQSKNIKYDINYVKNIINDLYTLPNEILNLINTSINNELIDYLAHQQHLFILGRKTCYPIALEGSLKIKEISYLHAEGYSGGALKHGPFALIDQGTPILLLVLKDDYYNLMLSACEEVKARGAYIIIITDCDTIPNSLYNQQIKINKLNELSSLLSVVPLQLIAYYLSIKKNINPDKPKNLAKVVTVS